MALNVAFYWHMHQPDYVDPVTNTALMPWVRLHSAKSYYDMVRLAEEFPKTPMTFNMTPVLVRQMLRLQRGEIKDAWLELSRTPAERLNEEMKFELLKHFFSAQHENMIRPFPRYAELLQMRGRDSSPQSLREAIRRFTVGDWRDLQVWFNLAWCGYFAIRDLPALDGLRKKGRGFTEADKTVVLDAHLELVNRSLAKYRDLAQSGRIEVTTSPFTHPILPLLYNTDFARRCMPQVALPPSFCYPQDVREHLLRAVELHEQVFGKKPTGLWPSEGSVCPEIVPLVREAGFEWMATDEEVLFRSLQMLRGDHGSTRREDLFRGYRVNHGGASVNMGFRDHGLSDFFGFVASRQKPEDAAHHVIENLAAIGRQNPNDDALALILLDGENAWQEFADGGEKLLRLIYGALGNDGRFRPITMTDYFRKYQPKSELNALHTGSWIYANFDIWIGDPEENRAWEMLRDVRRLFEEIKGTLTPAVREAAFQALLAAEGSDWYWWYGPEFQIEHKPMFDELFRLHIRAAYLAMGKPVPHAVGKSLLSGAVPSVVEQPREFISPTIDGRRTSFYEWQNSGIYRPSQGDHAMARSQGILRNVKFGFDPERFYLALEWNRSMEMQTAEAVTIDFAAPRKAQLRLTGLASPSTTTQLEVKGEGDFVSESSANGGQIQYCQGAILEIGIPRKLITVPNGKTLTLGLSIEVDGRVIEQHPADGSIEVAVPVEPYETDAWIG